MNVKLPRSAALAACLWICNAAVLAQSPPDDPAVEVRQVGDTVVVDASMVVPASREQVWTVLTDYDRMAQFSPNLRSSRVVARSDKAIQVEQTGSVAVGPFSVPFESLREIELKPFDEIHSRTLGGSLKRGTAFTRLAPDTAGVRILYHSESVPGTWTPPGLGTGFVARETRQQFQNLRAEILRRKGG